MIIDCEPSIYMSQNIALDNFISNHHNVIITTYVCGLTMMQYMAAEGVLGVKIFTLSFENPKIFRGHAPDPSICDRICKNLTQ